MEPANTSGKFYCHECVRTFTFKHNLKRHVTSIHRIISQDTGLLGVQAKPNRQLKLSESSEKSRLIWSSGDDTETSSDMDSTTETGSESDTSQETDSAMSQETDSDTSQETEEESSEDETISRRRRIKRKSSAMSRSVAYDDSETLSDSTDLDDDSTPGKSNQFTKKRC